MKRILQAVWMAALAACAMQGQVSSTPEPLTAWQYYSEVYASAGGSRLSSLVLNAQLLDKARHDLADVRLYNKAGREIPYVARIRREVDRSDVMEAREFNRSSDAGTSQISVDLGGQAQEHNEVEIDTAGDNFRRAAEVQGSYDGAQWNTLVAQGLVFRFSASGRSVDERVVTYPVSRYRFLRVRVHRDPQTDKESPAISAVRVRRSVRLRGELATFRGYMQGREADRSGGRLASVWHFRFDGRIPIQRLTLDVMESVFDRPYTLEAVDDPREPVVLASGQFRRTESDREKPVTIDFQEQYARRVKLTVIDDRNAALTLTGIEAASPAREVIFDGEKTGGGPLRVYVGNPDARAPHYDIALVVPTDPSVTRLHATVVVNNPDYRPAPKPFTERSPWLVYVVLGGACVVLALILLNIARMAKTEAVSNP